MISDNPPPADALKLETHTPEFRIGCVGSAQETLGRLTLAERGDAKAVAQVRRWLDEVDSEPSHD